MLAFRRAYWEARGGGEAARAKAGLFIAQYRLGKPLTEVEALLKQSTKDALVMILENEDQEDDTLLRYLGGVVRETKDPYLQGLYAFRVGKYQEAHQWFQQLPVSHARSRRFRAQVLKHLGQDSEALKLLETVLIEKFPDARELILLQELQPQEEARIQRKMQGLEKLNRETKRWWSDSFEAPFLEGKGQMMRGINLLPGKTRLQVFARAMSSSGNALIKVALNGKPIGAMVLHGDRWTPLSLEVNTTGGIRWLQVELDPNSRSRVELGPVRTNPSLGDFRHG